MELVVEITTEKELLIEKINELAEQNRAKCLWFVSPKFLPTTDGERLQTLANIERYGDRQAFMRARELKMSLLQVHK